ncbi:hypothetical protein [Streptomyces sp. FIT100]|nr:hypothetical protein [Streptomyces sp. FIT100]
MICTKCQKAIGPGEKYTTHDIHSASGPGSTVYRHVACPSRRTS